MMIVNYRFPASTKYADVWTIMDRVSKHGVKRWRLRAVKDGEAPWSEIEADPRVPADLVSAIVKTLLESGIKKVSIEIKAVAEPKPFLVADDPQRVTSFDPRGAGQHH